MFRANRIVKRRVLISHSRQSTDAGSKQFECTTPLLRWRDAPKLLQNPLRRREEIRRCIFLRQSQSDQSPQIEFIGAAEPIDTSDRNLGSSSVAMRIRIRVARVEDITGLEGHSRIEWTQRMLHDRQLSPWSRERRRQRLLCHELASGSED